MWHEGFPLGCLGGHEPNRLVRELVFGEVARPRGQGGNDFVEQEVEAVFLECRERYDFAELVQLAVFVDEREQAIFLLEQVDLVEQQEDGAPVAMVPGNDPEQPTTRAW